MKAWLLSLCGLSAFLIAGYLVQSSLNQTANRLDRQLAEVEEKLAAGDWDQVSSGLKKVQNTWEQAKTFWAVVTNHKEMDLIEEALIKTIKASSCKSYADAAINLGALRQFIKHIPERERFSMVNIF